MNNAQGEDTRNVGDRFRGMSVESIKSQLQSDAFDFHVAIENFQHDFNIGSIVRSANAFNAKAVHIIGKRHWNRRGAMSTEKYLDVFHYPDTNSFVEWALSQELTIVGIDNIADSKDLSQTRLPKKCVLVFGQEGPGLSPDMIQASHSVVRIEQFGSTRSINVGAAAAIIMYQWIVTNHFKGVV